MKKIIDKRKIKIDDDSFIKKLLIFAIILSNINYLVIFLKRNLMVSNNV